MTINSLRKQGWVSLILAPSMLLSSFFVAGGTAYAADLTITAAPTDTQILTQNGGTVVTTFLPEIGASIDGSATSSVSAYYGVRIVSATTTGDVHWRITVSHATSTLASGDVTITEKGYFDADSHEVADSAYTAAEASGDLVFTGNGGWETSAGDDFTNVDQITFDSDAPSGVYTVTRELIEASTTMPISGSYSFDVTLNAAAGIGGTGTTTPITINAPVLVNGQFCTSISPLTVSGMADADANISIVGGNGTTTATANGSGAFSASVPFSSTSTSPLMITASDSGGTVLATTTLNVIFDNTAPVISFGNATSSGVFVNTNFDSMSGVTVNDASGTATTTVSGNFDISTPGTYTLTYTATDCAGNTATSTRTIEVHQTGSSGGGSSSGGSSSGSGSVASGNVTSGAIGYVLAGQVIDGRAQVGIPNTGSFLFTRQLSRGSRGEDVAALQMMLTGLGFYRGPITGYYGDLTAAAVARLQASLGISTTGTVGPITLAALNS